MPCRIQDACLTRLAAIVICGSWWFSAAQPTITGQVPQSTDLRLTLQSRAETSPGSGRYHVATRPESWDPRKSAIIVCDMWDLHHCLNAVRREGEFAPRLEQVLQSARRRGVTIIHAPSECMDAYKTHPARLQAQAVPKATDLPKEITTWCSRIPAEERGRYPVDQSDGGEDDDLVEHKAWAAKLQSMGRNPKMPWKKQTDLLTIDDKDFVSDKGDEIWSILQQHGIDNVILAGVHTNMCVLGRPFGLRQMARNGKHVVLMRDMTDTMYNPERWPFVSHFTATDYIVEHIEKFVCPTITSDQLIGGVPFRYRNDKRPHLVMVIGEDEYETATTLPAFAAKHLGKDFRVSYVFADDKDPHNFPGIEVLDQADVALISVRRRGLKPEQMASFRRFVQAGKPLVGIRTASHAFSPKKDALPPGRVDWPEFDKEVLGGNYHGHHGNKDSKDPHSYVRVAADSAGHPLLTGISKTELQVPSHLYKTSPLAEGTTVLLTGRVAGREPPEPVAWTFVRSNGGRTFYTSLGHVEEFKTSDFQTLLLNGIYWCAMLPAPTSPKAIASKSLDGEHWDWIRLPLKSPKQTKGTAWYRCLVRVPQAWANQELTLSLKFGDGHGEVFFNGHKVGTSEQEVKSAATVNYRVPATAVESGELNLLAVRFQAGPSGDGSLGASDIQCGKAGISLQGPWQYRQGDDPAWASLALPAKFAASTDVIFELYPRSDK